MKNNILKPFEPLKTEGSENSIKITAGIRTYSFDKSLLFSSVIANGTELLKEKCSVIINESEGDYAFNNAEVFVLSQSDEEVTICASEESRKFIINTVTKIRYDGLALISLTVVPRGKTVNQVFGVEKDLSKDYSLNKLQVSIHLNKDAVKYYHYWPLFYKDQLPVYENCSEQPEFSKVAMSRSFNSSMRMEFKPILYLFNDDCGLSFQAESDEHWKYEDKKAIEIIKDKDETLLKLNLLSSHPDEWDRHTENPDFLENYGYMPLTYKFSLQATPVKEKINSLYKEKSLHIDCFKKIPEDYYSFLLKKSKREGFLNNLDYIKSCGVTMLYLHEKWNNIQNYPYVSVKRSMEIKEIISECHKRGIKVIPYFGYEISTLSPLFSEKGLALTQYVGGQYPNFGGWYRMPPQRCYIECLNTEFKDLMLKGFKEFFNEFDFDGIYLDSTFYPDPCCNMSHGCGYKDISGKLHNTYAVNAIHDYAEEIFRIVKSHGGTIEMHSSNCINVSAFAFADCIWDGEAVQSYIHENSVDAIPVDYLYSEHPVNALGVDYEYLVYTFDNWTFKDGLALSLPLGILPKPNDIEEPLSVMTGIWKIYEDFGVYSADHCDFIRSVKDSVFSVTGECLYGYYRKTVKGKKEYLFIISNPRSKAVKASVNADFNYTAKDMLSGGNISGSISLKPCETKILLMEEM